MTQNNLGTALMRMGERESGTARLEEAVTAYRAALDTFAAANAAYYVAICRQNLNEVLSLLAKRKN